MAARNEVTFVCVASVSLPTKRFLSACGALDVWLSQHIYQKHPGVLETINEYELDLLTALPHKRLLVSWLLYLRYRPS